MSAAPRCCAAAVQVPAPAAQLRLVATRAVAAALTDCRPPCTVLLLVIQVPAPTLQLHLNITQPLMNQTGQLRWALNNVASEIPSPCEPLLDLVYK